MQNLLKDDYEAFIASLKQEEVKGFYLNPLKQDVLKHLDTKYIQNILILKKGYYFDYKNYPLGKSPYFMCGLTIFKNQCHGCCFLYRYSKR